MPQYRIIETVHEIAQGAVLLDTGVLVAAFSPSESQGRTDYAEFYLEHVDVSLLVPSMVIVEAWGVIVGRDGARSRGLDLLTWLNRPGRATVMYANSHDIDRAQRLLRGLPRIDVVDAMLVELATDITEACGLHHALPIATFDPSDFVNMSRKHRIRLRVVDMRSEREDPYDTL